MVTVNKDNMDTLSKIKLYIIADWYYNVNAPYQEHSDEFLKACSGIDELVEIAKAYAPHKELKKIDHAKFMAKDGLVCYGLDMSHVYFEAGIYKGFDNVELLSELINR